MEVTLSNGEKALVVRLTDIAPFDAFREDRGELVGKRFLIVGVSDSGIDDYQTAGAIALEPVADIDFHAGIEFSFAGIRFEQAEATDEEIQAAGQFADISWVPSRDILNP